MDRNNPYIPLPIRGSAEAAPEGVIRGIMADSNQIVSGKNSKPIVIRMAESGIQKSGTAIDTSVVEAISW
jgi:hypothetical protein